MAGVTGTSKRYFWRNVCFGDREQRGSVGEERGGVSAGGVQVVRWPHSNCEEGCEWEGGGERGESKGCAVLMSPRGI